MKRPGFTLIELVLVLGIIGILACIVLVAINPTKQLADQRDSQRRSDVNSILDAVFRYAIDNDADLPTGISGDAQEICQTEGDCEGLLDLSVLTEEGKYLERMPVDPLQTGDNETDYTIVRLEDGKVQVAAPSSEMTDISVSR